MKISKTNIASLNFDFKGNAYFMVGETPYHLNEFIKTTGKYDGVTHITNTGGMGININEINEEVQYTFFTNA